MYMKELNKVEKQLIEMEKNIESDNIENLSTLQEICQKLLKFLIGTKRYFQKQKEQDITQIKELIKQTKRLETQIVNRKKELMEKQNKDKKRPNNKKMKKLEEVSIAKAIMDSTIMEDEKITKLEQNYKSIYEHIKNFLLNKNLKNVPK